jgi:hypothetical protein
MPIPFVEAAHSIIQSPAFDDASFVYGLWGSILFKYTPNDHIIAMEHNTKATSMGLYVLRNIHYNVPVVICKCKAPDALSDGIWNSTLSQVTQCVKAVKGAKKRVYVIIGVGRKVKFYHYDMVSEQLDHKCFGKALDVLDDAVEVDELLSNITADLPSIANNQCTD